MTVVRRSFLLASVMTGALAAVPAVADAATTTPGATAHSSGELTALQVAEQIAASVQTKVLPTNFAENAVYVMPFAIPGTPQTITGSAAILAHFQAGSSNPASQALEIQQVNPTYYQGQDPGVVVFELEIQGVVTATGDAFTLNSSIGVLTVRCGEIVSWHDYSNIIGGSAAAGTIPQLVTVLDSLA